MTAENRIDRWAVVDRFGHIQGPLTDTPPNDWNGVDWYNNSEAWEHFRPFRICRLVELRDDEVIVNGARDRTVAALDDAIKQDGERVGS